MGRREDKTRQKIEYHRKLLLSNSIPAGIIDIILLAPEEAWTIYSEEDLRHLRRLPSMLAPGESIFMIVGAGSVEPGAANIDNGIFVLTNRRLFFRGTNGGSATFRLENVEKISTYSSKYESAFYVWSHGVSHQFHMGGASWFARVFREIVDAQQTY
jgi:hypothetical protein